MRVQFRLRWLVENDAGMQTMQSVMILAVSALVLLGMRMLWDPKYSGSGGLFAAVEQKFDVIFNGGEETVADSTNPDGSGGGGSGDDGSGDEDSDEDSDEGKNRRDLLRERLEQLRAEYAEIAKSCEQIQGSDLSHSCILQNQVLKLTELTLGKMDADSLFYPDWITGILEQSKPTVRETAELKSWWLQTLSRKIASFYDLPFQIGDAVITPADVVVYVRQGYSLREAFEKALEKSYYNFGDASSAIPGILHFVQDLSPGFEANAAQILRDAISRGGSEAEIQAEISRIDSQHRWLLGAAVPEGFRLLADEGKIGIESAHTATDLVPLTAELMRELMWDQVLPEFGIKRRPAAD